VNGRVALLVARLHKQHLRDRGRGTRDSPAAACGEQEEVDSGQVGGPGRSGSAKGEGLTAGLESRALANRDSCVPTPPSSLAQIVAFVFTLAPGRD
jgi:hypothetical protein